MLNFRAFLRTESVRFACPRLCYYTITKRKQMHLKDLCGTLKLSKRESMFDNPIAILAILEYNKNRTFVCILGHMGQQRSVW